MKRFLIYLFISFFVLGIDSYIYSLNNTIGYIDYLKVFSEYKETKNMQLQIQKKQAEINKIIEDAKKKGLDEKKLNQLKLEKEKELGNFVEKIRNTLKNRILAEVEKVARTQKLSVVLEKNARVWGGVDITKEILNNLNK
jgi:outer membrane protein